MKFYVEVPLKLSAAVQKRVVDHLKEHRKIDAAYVNGHFEYSMQAPEEKDTWKDVPFDDRVNRLEHFYSIKVPSCNKLIDSLAWEFAADEFVNDLKVKKDQKYIHSAVYSHYYKTTRKNKKNEDVVCYVGGGNLIGRVVASIPANSNTVYVGWSLCKREDRYKANVSLFVAFHNSVALDKLDNAAIPHTLRKHVLRMAQRAKQYFKQIAKVAQPV